MIDFDTTQRLVLERLAQSERKLNPFGSALNDVEDRPVHHLVVSGVTEYEFGWVFFYNSKAFLETGDVLRHFLVGNAPFIVHRNDGRVYITGTAQSIDHYVEEYRRGNRKLA
jgi:hypothetical protein